MLEENGAPMTTKDRRRKSDKQDRWPVIFCARAGQTFIPIGQKGLAAGPRLLGVLTGFLWI